MEPAEVAAAVSVRVGDALRRLGEVDLPGLDLGPRVTDESAGFFRGLRHATFRHHDDVSHVDFLAALRLIAEAILEERLDLGFVDRHPRSDHRVDDLAAFDLALDLCAVLVDGEPVARDACQELFHREAVLGGDRLDRPVDLFAVGAQLESLDDGREQLVLDQALERIAPHLQDLGRRRAGRAHALFHRGGDLHHLGGEHDLVTDLSGDALDELLGSGRGCGPQHDGEQKERDQGRARHAQGDLRGATPGSRQRAIVAMLPEVVWFGAICFWADGQFAGSTSSASRVGRPSTRAARAARSMRWSDQSSKGAAGWTPFFYSTWRFMPVISGCASRCSTIAR